MTRMKHYHLGCGEPLQSQRSELLQIAKAANMERIKPRLPGVPKSKPGKRH